MTSPVPYLPETRVIPEEEAELILRLWQYFNEISIAFNELAAILEGVREDVELLKENRAMDPPQGGNG